MRTILVCAYEMERQSEASQECGWFKLYMPAAQQAAEFERSNHTMATGHSRLPNPLGHTNVMYPFQALH